MCMEIIKQPRKRIGEQIDKELRSHDHIEVDNCVDTHVHMYLHMAKITLEQIHNTYVRPCVCTYICL